MSSIQEAIRAFFSAFRDDFVNSSGASTAVALILCSALIAFVVWRLIKARQEPWEIEGEEEDLARWKRQRERLLRSIKDLELEHAQGSIGDDDHQGLRRSRMVQVIEVTKRLERARRARLRAILHKGGASRQVRVKQVEAEVRRRLKSLAVPGAAQPDGGSR